MLKRWRGDCLAAQLGKEFNVSRTTSHEHQLMRLEKAIAVRVGSQRFHVWFNNSTRLDLKQDGLDISVPNDFISEWIENNFASDIQEAAREVVGGPLLLRFSVVPQLFEVGGRDHDGGGVVVAERARSERHERSPLNGSPLLDSPREAGGLGLSVVDRCIEPPSRPRPVRTNGEASPLSMESMIPSRPRLRHDIESFVVGPSNQMAYNAALYVAEFPGAQYNPLFIHGGCGLGKTHLLQGLCKRFQKHHPTMRWTYLTAEEFTNGYLTAMRNNKLDVFRRKMRDLDLLVIDDVHFLAGKKATQEEFLHTFNSIEAMGKQVVMASDEHPKMIVEFNESLVNRFVSGMIVRVDAPNFITRCDILRALAVRAGFVMPDEVVCWVARRVTQNVRELEGAVTRIAAHMRMSDSQPDVAMVQDALGDLDRQMIAPVKPEAILQAVCEYFGIETKDLMSSRRQRTVSLARSLAMYLIRKTAKLSYPEIGLRMGKRNHSTVISACQRVDRAMQRNEPLIWTSSIGPRREEACDLVQRLEEHSRVVH
jgi:chromosomal replication initiator protein